MSRKKKTCRRVVKNRRKADNDEIIINTNGKNLLYYSLISCGRFLEGQKGFCKEAKGTEQDETEKSTNGVGRPQKVI